MKLAKRVRTAASLVACAAMASGCVGFTPVNVPLERADAAYGYRPSNPAQHRAAGRVFVLVSFSGGGTRAAAFAYGVLEELRDTEVVVAGERKRLLDEVDTLSGVSGGSFPAAYYGLFGDRIFEEFEPHFLRRNIQRSLVLRTLRPINLFRVLTPALSRSDLAADLYHEELFDEATFADLAAAKGPRVYINATDLSGGYRFTFSQGQFDVICSDLDPFPIARAVAASSAVPMLLSPITLKNNAGTCDYQPPRVVLEGLEARRADPRRYHAARAMTTYLDVGDKPYIHLVDGATSDNLGLRATLDLTAAAGGAGELLSLYGVEVPDHLVVIIVNAETDPDPAIDLSYAAPSFAALMTAVNGGQIRRYNFETIQLTRQAVDQAARELSRRGRPVKGHVVLVDFENFEDEEERRYFRRLPTSFFLPDPQIDRLLGAGRTLLRDSPDFQDLLEELR